MIRFALRSGSQGSEIVAGFRLEFIFLPFRLHPHGVLVSAFNHDFVTGLGDAAESAICVYQMKGQR